MQNGSGGEGVQENLSLLLLHYKHAAKCGYPQVALKLGNGSDTADETGSGKAAPEGVGAVGNTKELKVVNDAREDQLGTDNNRGGGTGTKLGDGQDVDNDKEGTDDTSGPGPPGGFGES